MTAIVETIPPKGGGEGANEITHLDTSDQRARTRDGLGVGDSQSAVEEAYPEVSCDTGTGEIRVCRLGREQAGSIVTDFFVEDDAVTRIVVGRIID